LKTNVYGRLITLLVFVLLGLMGMAFAFNYLWVKAFGLAGAANNIPRGNMQPMAAADNTDAEAERELEREREIAKEHEEQRLAKIQADRDKKAKEAAKRAKELPAKRAAWQAQEEAKSAEQKAQEALRLAIDLLEADRREPAHRRLREIIEKYPDTKAAAEARSLLKK
jgi:TolA-binding protein